MLIQNQPRGYVRIIASRLSLSCKAVYDAVKNGLLDLPVIEEMIRIAEDHKNRMVSLNDRINKIIS